MPREKGRKKGEREGEWDTCPIMGSWKQIMLSLPNQPCADTWQGKSHFILKFQLLLITLGPSFLINPII
jgi:hypothetical protein